MDSALDSPVLAKPANVEPMVVYLLKILPLVLVKIVIGLLSEGTVERALLALILCCDSCAYCPTVHNASTSYNLDYPGKHDSSRTQTWSLAFGIRLLLWTELLLWTDHESFNFANLLRMARQNTKACILDVFWNLAPSPSC
jgi:hypothetical protein